MLEGGTSCLACQLPWDQIAVMLSHTDEHLHSNSNPCKDLHTTRRQTEEGTKLRTKSACMTFRLDMTIVSTESACTQTGIPRLRGLGASFPSSEPPG